MRKTAAIYCLVSMMVGSTVEAEPRIEQPGFRVTKFTEFDLKPLRCFGLAISNGRGGYPPGLFISTGPLPDRDRVLFADTDGKVSVFASGFVSNEGITFGRGAYGPWLYVASIKEGAIYKVLPDGSREIFAADGFTKGTAEDSNFGPAQLAWGPDGFMYATDYSGGKVVRVRPDGSTEVLTNRLGEFRDKEVRSISMEDSRAVAPQSTPLRAGGAKPIAFLDSAYHFDRQFEGTALVGLYNRNAAPLEGRLIGLRLQPFAVKAEISMKAVEMEGLQLASSGPGGSFGYRYFVASEGIKQPDEMNDGALYSIDESWEPKLFLTNLDATQAVFDAEGVLGGGMLVCDMNQELWPEKLNTIWHVLPDQ